MRVSEAETNAALEERRLSALSGEVARKKMEADERETRWVLRLDSRQQTRKTARPQAADDIFF